MDEYENRDGITRAEERYRRAITDVARFLKDCRLRRELGLTENDSNKIVNDGRYNPMKPRDFTK